MLILFAWCQQSVSFCILYDEISYFCIHYAKQASCGRLFRDGKQILALGGVDSPVVMSQE